MRPVRVTVGSVAKSATIPVNVALGVVNIGIGCTLSTGGSATYSVEHTYDDVFDPAFNATTAKWFTHSTLSAKTASADGAYVNPITACRLNVTAWTSGTVTMTVIQAGIE